MKRFRIYTLVSAVVFAVLLVILTELFGDHQPWGIMLSPAFYSDWSTGRSVIRKKSGKRARTNNQRIKV